MPPLIELETELVTFARSPLGRQVEEKLALEATKLAEQSGGRPALAIGGLAAKLDSGTAELNSIHFPELQHSADFTFQIKSGAELRSVNVHLPSNFNPAKPTPAYFLMDGAQYGDPEGEMLQGYHWSETADKNGFAAISLVQSESSSIEIPARFAKMFPQHSTWRSPFGLVAPSNAVDDVRYFDDVLRGVRNAMNVGRINVVGFCDGGCLAHGLATRIPMNGIATVGSTIIKTERALPLPGARGFFATMKDDPVLQEAGGAGRSFGRLLAQAGHTRVIESAPLEQGSTYARANGLIPASTSESSIGVERDWVKPGTMETGVKEISLKEGGHNWPGTKFSTLSKAKADQISPDAARTFNQQIVEFFDTPTTIHK